MAAILKDKMATHLLKLLLAQTHSLALKTYILTSRLSLRSQDIGKILTLNGGHFEIQDGSTSSDIVMSFKSIPWPHCDKIDLLGHLKANILVLLLYINI